jgi:short-subunit dehydrogenase
MEKQIQKMCLLQGSTTGIGYPITETFARNGYHVYGRMRNPQKALMSIHWLPGCMME